MFANMLMALILFGTTVAVIGLAALRSRDGDGLVWDLALLQSGGLAGATALFLHLQEGDALTALATGGAIGVLAFAGLFFNCVVFRDELELLGLRWRRGGPLGWRGPSKRGRE